MIFPLHVTELTKKTAKIANRDTVGIFKPKTNTANARKANRDIFFLLDAINTLTLLIPLILINSLPVKATLHKALRTFWPELPEDTLL